MKKLLVSLMFLSSSSFAEDYYAPVPKELEPMARIPINDFVMKDETVSYTLPRDLTGTPNKIVLERDHSVAGESLRIFRGTLADVACMGTNDLPACVVTHKGLALNTDESNTFLSQKYKDPAKLKEAKAVRDQFASGAQPLGVIAKRNPVVPPSMPKEWSLEILSFGGIPGSLPDNWGDYKLDLNQNTFGDGWKISSVNIDGNHISAFYVRAGVTHWLDLFINTERNAAQGTWGVVNNGVHSEAQGVLRTKPVAPRSK